MALPKALRPGLIAAAAAICALAMAAPASAATVQATCASLRSDLSSATNGETIVLRGLCTGAQASYTLPAGVTDLTLEGAGTGTNGFDGTGASSPALTGPNVAGGLTLRNLTVENYSLSSSPVYLYLGSGVLPQFDDDRFLDNTETTNGYNWSGALWIYANSSTCQYAGTLAITDSTFSGNTAITTGGATSTSGADILFWCGSGTANLKFTGNRFIDNTVSTTGASVYGSALYAVNVGNGSNVTELSAQQSHNLQGQLDRLDRLAGHRGVRGCRRVARFSRSDQHRRRIHRQHSAGPVGRVGEQLGCGSVHGARQLLALDHHRLGEADQPGRGR